MKRDLCDVIDAMLEVIPVHQGQDSLIAALKSRKQSASYAAPEMQPMWWTLTYETLSQYVFEDVDDYNDWVQYLKNSNQYWKEDLRKIWVGE